ncbi:hypothetical protein JCM10213_000520 [Rhodosporidiobolus nylandii]
MAEAEWIELTAHYNGVYIFLSYLVSVVGAWTSLEMLLKRTGSSGAWNVMLLVAAGVAFGSTATFGMHFVGNQAVTLRFPAPWEGRGARLSYSAGYTVLSLVVSCLSMILAFSFIGLRLSAPRWRARLTDEEQASTHSSEKDPAGEVDDDDEYEDAAPDDRGGGFGEPKRPGGDMVTGGAFDPDLKVDDSHHAKATLPGGRRMSLPGTAFKVHFPKRGGEKAVAEKRRREQDDGDEESSEDGGDFGVHAAKLSGWGIAKVFVTGVICGGGIAAMHYVGQVSINSVSRVTNDWYMVLISVLIAVACVTVGLYILFVVFRPKLKHSLGKRVIVAMILAVGVTLMHFVALLGTHYWAKEGQSLRSGSVSNNGTKRAIIAIICIVAPVCCISLLAFAFIAQQRMLRQRLSRHQIILSTAIFDQQGLLMVQPESGLLPSAKIYPSQTNEAEKVGFFQLLGIGQRLSLRASKLKLARSDPAFIAFVKLSWGWRSRRGPLPGANGRGGEVDSTYGGTGSKSSEGGASTPRMSVADDELDASDAEIVRRSILSFQIASEEIANQITGSNDLKVLGVMYDSILKIGHFQVASKSSGDQFTVTQGQMLVLARRLKNNTERDALLARGFVFAEPTAVARVTSNAYAVPIDRVFDYFRDVYRFTRFGVNKRLDRGRLYGGLLMLQAVPGEGLHVVVDDRQHHSLPMVELGALIDPKSDRARFASYPNLVTTLEDVVASLDQLAGQSLLDLMNTPSHANDPASPLRTAIVTQLRAHLERVLSASNLEMLLSRIQVAPQIVPLTSRPGPLYSADSLSKDSYLVCVKAVIPSSVTFPGPRLPWFPFPLFQAQSECVSKALGSNAITPSRPNTGGSVVEAARFGGERRVEAPRFGGGWSALSYADAGEKSSALDQQDNDLPFSTVTSAPFTSAALSTRASEPGGSTFSASATDTNAKHGAPSPRPMTGQQAADLPPGVPVYSPDWIVALVRGTVHQPGGNMLHWDVPHKLGGGTRSKKLDA